MLLLGSGEKSRSVSGSSLGRPRLPPRPLPPLTAGEGALTGIRAIGGPLSKVITSPPCVGAGEGLLMLGMLETLAIGFDPGPWGLGPRKLKGLNQALFR